MLNQYLHYDSNIFSIFFPSFQFRQANEEFFMRCHEWSVDQIPFGIALTGHRSLVPAEIRHRRGTKKR